MLVYAFAVALIGVSLGFITATGIITVALTLWTFEVNFLWGLVALIASPILWKIFLVPLLIFWNFLYLLLPNRELHGENKK